MASWRADGPFDVVVGRLILFHVPDPVGVLRHHQQAVRSGGRVVMIDYDIGGLRATPSDPLTGRMAALVMAAFRAAGADPTIGSRLKRILAEAGVEDVDGFAIAQYLANDDPVGPAMLGPRYPRGLPRLRTRAGAMVAHVSPRSSAVLDLDTLVAPRAYPPLALHLCAPAGGCLPPVLVVSLTW